MSLIERFYTTHLGAEDTPYVRAVSMYHWTAMAHRIEHPGAQADMAPIWVSPQGSGKTSSLREMVLEPDWYGELNLQDRDADLSRLIKGKVLIELPELRGLNSKDIEWIKAFISRREERWIPKFMEFATVYKRRCIFIGTTNSDQFLADETGNRRFLPVRLGRKQDIQAIIRDRRKLWAEAGRLAREKGILWQDAARLAPVEHENFMVHDILEDKIARWLGEMELGQSRTNGDREFLTTEEIACDCLHLEVNRLRGNEGQKIARIMRKLGYEPVRIYMNGVKVRAWRKV